MVKRVAIFLLATILALSAISIIPANAQKKVVGLDLTFNALPDGKKLYRVKDIYTTGFDHYIRDLKGNLTLWGYEAKEINGLTSDNLKGVDGLILAKLYDPSVNYTASEVSAVGAWFKTGGKFLYIGSDSDFVEAYYDAKVGNFKQDQPNKILEAIGSSLRIEFASVEDAVGLGAAGAPYRVFANETGGGVNKEGMAGSITKGVSRVLFHGPTVLVGFKGGKYVSFDQVLDENTVWLFRTSEKGTIVHNTPTPTKVVIPGQRGRFILAGAQKVKIDGAYSKVIAAGESMMGDRNGLTLVERGVTFQGTQYLQNALAWGLTAEQVPVTTTPVTRTTPTTTAPAQDNTMMYAVVAVIVAIAAIFGATRMRKKK